MQVQELWCYNVRYSYIFYLLQNNGEHVGYLIRNCKCYLFL